MAFADIRQDIINGLDSATGGPFAWNAQIRDLIPVSSVVRTSATVVTITLPAAASYNISVAETITATVPSSALTGAVAVTATPTFEVTPVALSFADIRQDIINGLDSAQFEEFGWNAEVRNTLPVSAVVRTSATVVTITLPSSPSYNITAPETITVTVPASAVSGGGAITASPSFSVSALSSFDAIRQDIINGLDSAQSEALGWNQQVRDSLPVSAVVRTSDTVVTITLDPSSSYDITAPETITVTVPASALDGPANLTASPTFTVALVGVSGFAGVRQAIIDGLDSDKVEPFGWNAQIRDQIPESSVVRTSDTRVTITLPQTLAYDISAAETITATVPDAALENFNFPVTASPQFVVSPELGTFAQIRQLIINGLNSSQSEPFGWNAQVRDQMLPANVTRTSDTVVTIFLPSSPLYNINALETITATIPSEALVLGASDVVAVPVFTVSSTSPVLDVVSTAGAINTYDIGDVVRLTGVFLNLVNVEQDPDAVSLKVASPSVTTTYVYPTHIVKDSIANYHMDYLVTERGDFYTLWIAEGAGQATEAGQFVVRASMVQ